jgi:ferredoxin
MPKVTVQNKIVECEKGANLREVLLKNNIDLYNEKAKYINCLGIGTCGTCAVEIQGEINPPNWKDKTRLSLPPHKFDRNLRLACQTKVLGDITVSKYDKFWGQGQKKIW